MRFCILVFLIFVISFSGLSSVQGEVSDLVTVEKDDLGFVRIETSDISGFNTKINVYADITYTSMGDMVMVMNGMGNNLMYMQMKDSDVVALEHTNFIFEVSKDNLKLQFNFETKNLLSGVNNSLLEKGNHQLAEVYGEYRFNNNFSIRGGKFFAPFGIYNSIRYVSPMISTIALPTIYELPGHYHKEAFYPPNPNVMISSNILLPGDAEFEGNLYFGSGKKDDSGLGFESTPSIGGRIKLVFNGQNSVGVSAYTLESAYRGQVLNQTIVDFGRENVLAFDTELVFLNDKLTLQSEFVRSNYRKTLNRKSYYVRLMYDIGRFTPFVMYDVLDDSGDFVYRNKMSRYGIGFNYKINENVFFKTEYHYHSFSKYDDLPKKLRTTNMVKISLSAAF